jgi:hypothetical protein
VLIESFRKTRKHGHTIALAIRRSEQRILDLLNFVEQTVMLTVHLGNAGQQASRNENCAHATSFRPCRRKSSIEQAGLQWSQVVLLYGEADRHAMPPDSLDDHPSGNGLGNNPDVTRCTPVSADIGSNTTGTRQPGGFGSGHGPSAFRTITKT